MLTDLTPRLDKQALNGPTMGTRYAAVFYAPLTAPLGGLERALRAAVDEVDAQMSTWKAESDLMRFNRVPVGVWAEVPQRLFDVVACGLDIGRRSHGAFDIGLGDMVRAWGFTAMPNRPDAQAIAQLGPRPATYEVLDLDAARHRLRKRAPMALDLSGIAKGYGVDRLAETLEAHGIADYLVSIDGEVRARGHKPDGQPWQVAIEAPDPGKRDVAGIVALSEGALATSGDYRHRVVFDGVEHSHTMDRRTGRPLDNGIAAVTTRAPTCMLADAWATACLVLGPERGLPLARANGIEALYALR